jgi:hypothetical protein
MKILSTIVISLTMLACSANGQGVGASGDIKGTVTDPSGAVVSKATVTATNAGNGLKRTATSDNDGQFLISGLSPAKYDVSAEITGFQTQVQTGVVVTIGQVFLLDFHLKLAQVSTTVEISAEPPIVETTKSHQSELVTTQYILDLPIDRRDYLTFTLLMPGVSDSTRVAGDQDYRVKQTPQSGLSFYGSNGRGNSVTVDGGEANDDAGGVRLTVSQEAVQEFQINRSNYSAELGGASGASINIVTKSGTNNIHGSAFGFFRNQNMDASDPFAKTQALASGQNFNPANPDSLGVPVKDALSRQQYGGSFGMPIKKNKTFLFMSFEGLRQNSQDAVPILQDTNIFRPSGGLPAGVPATIPVNNQLAIISGLAAEGATPVPCLTGQPALPAATCAGILTNILTINPTTSPLNAFIVNQFENNGGLSAFTTRSYFASGRLDHQLDSNNQLFFAYTFGHDQEQSPDVRALTGFSRGSSVLTYDDTLRGAWFHQFSANTQNELRLQWSYNKFNVVPTVPGEVGLDISGFASLGTNIFLPSRTTTMRPEVADNVTLIRGHHSIRFGFYALVRGNHTQSNTFFPGRFEFGALPGGILSPCLQVPAACGLAASVTSATINPLQAVSLGLPQFYQQGFGNPTYNFTRPFLAGYGQDTWQIRPNLTFTYGLRYEVDAQSGAMPTDKDNFAPRVSFAWDPFKDSKTVIRGGYGIYYAPIYAQIPDVVQTLGNINGVRQIANILVPLTGVPGSAALTSAAIFQTLFAQGKVQCTIPTAGNAACITPADLTQFGINITNSGPLPPLTVIFGVQKNYQSPYSQQGSFGIERAIISSLSVSASYIYVHTSRLPVAIDANLLPAPIVGGIRNWAAPSCTANPFSCFVNPLITQNNVYSSIASALYQGGILEVKERFNPHISLIANYTYSKATDNTTDFNSDYAPFDQTNINGDRGLSEFDQRHKVVIASILTSPWKPWYFSDFELSPIFRYNTGHPFNLLAGSDVNGDRHFTNDRPIGIGRDTGLGPNYYTFDLRFSRNIRFRDHYNIQLMAEAFNLTNRTNYASVNNIVGASYTGPAHPHGFVATAAVTPGGTPLAFTSDYAKREIQLGARFAF